MKSVKKATMIGLFEFSKEPKSINDFMSDLDLSIPMLTQIIKQRDLKILH